MQENLGAKYKKSAKSVEKTYSELYSIIPELYDDLKISYVGMGISVRTYNRLYANNILTVGDLLRCRESELMQINGFGIKCVDEIAKYIRTLKSQADSEIKSPEKNVSSQATIRLKEYRDDIFEGSFSFADELQLTEQERTLLESYKNAHVLLDKSLIDDCRVDPAKLTPVRRMLYGLVSEWNKREEKKDSLRKVLQRIPDGRRNTYAIGYINAYSEDDEIRDSIIHIYGNEQARLGDIVGCDLRSDVDYARSLRFLEWCAFDIDQEIRALFARLYKKENMRVVLIERSRHHTLDYVGKILGVTRERVRQIEVKARKHFSAWYVESKMLAKISAVRNGDYVLTPAELQEYFGDYCTEMLYLLRTAEGLPYAYDEQLDVYVIDNADLSERIQDYVELLPDVFHISKKDKFLKEAEEKGLSSEMTEIAIEDGYQITGDTYHRNRLSLGKIYNIILRKYYKDGCKVYDEKELEKFRQIVVDEFGDIGLPKNNRALTSRISSVGILCGRGLYKSKEDVSIPADLISNICQYIDDSENVIFLTNTLFSVFEDELLELGIDNKYFLQGILREKTGDRYVFRRDYISKDDNVTSIYPEVVRYIKNYNYPVSKKQIMDAFPGMTEIVFSFSVNDPKIINLFGGYIHADKLKFLGTDRAYFKTVIENMMAKSGYCNVRDVFDRINREDPVRLSRLYILYQYSLFGVLEYLFKDEYQFLRPYIAKLGVVVEHPSERMDELVKNSEVITLAEIREFAREIHYSIYNILDYVNQQNDTHLLKNDMEIATIESLGVDEECAKSIEEAILKEINGTVLISELKCIYKFPAIKVPWTEWLIYSVIRKWSTSLEVNTIYSTPSRQFRYSFPVVSLKGEFQPDEVDSTNATGDVGVVDDLDNIDDLIADFIEDELVGL
ncbi:MAG: hypothetical protein LIO65_07865 [Odoribacter sp.]|nr:hypothetical protein [Odoribacter sp.]